MEIIEYQIATGKPFSTDDIDYAPESFLNQGFDVLGQQAQADDSIMKKLTGIGHYGTSNFGTIGK